MVQNNKNKTDQISMRQKAAIYAGLREPEDYGTTYKKMELARQPLGRRAKAAVGLGVVAGLAAGGALFGRALDHELDQMGPPRGSSDPVPAMTEEPGRSQGMKPLDAGEAADAAPQLEQPGESTGEGPLEEITPSTEIPGEN